MKYYAHIGINGKILGWYNEEIHTTKTLGKDNNIVLDKSKIPTPNIEVSEENYLKIREEKLNAYDKVTKTFILKDFRTEEEKEAQEKKRKVAEIDKRLAEIDKEAVRPTRSIKVAELQGKEPNKYDIDKLVALEEEAQKLREERVEIAK